MKVTPKQKMEVKAQGFLFNRESEDEFSARIITRNGTISSDKMQIVADAAKRFGNGNMTFTTRLTIELPGIKYENIKPLQEFLASVGLETGGTGAKIRPVTACKGTTCVFGQIDTQAIALQIHERFYEGWKDVKLPHKFKIAVGGCPNNCMKPDLNDFGIIGQNKPLVDQEACRGCKTCVVADGCLMHAVSKPEKAVIDPEKCNSCGKCIRTCPFHAVSSQAHGVKVVIGGKWGRQGRKADALPGIYTVEQALDLLEKTLHLYIQYGSPKERFGDMLDRIGADTFIGFLLESAKQ